tara:strand:+ start:3558 stop:3707 length:150 start_codon:yes stop_codon:yes gene_type:complete
MPRTITVMIKDDFDPTLGADVIEAVENFEQLLQVEFEERRGSNASSIRY